jgi:hypothetical protein
MGGALGLGWGCPQGAQPCCVWLGEGGRHPVAAGLLAREHAFHCTVELSALWFALPALGLKVFLLGGDGACGTLMTPQSACMGDDSSSSSSQHTGAMMHVSPANMCVALPARVLAMSWRYGVIALHGVACKMNAYWVT